MSEAVGQVSDGRWGRAEALAYRPAHQQVAHERLTADQQLVGEHVARADLEAVGGQQRPEPRLLLGASVEVVLEHDRLAVQRECGELRIGLEHVDHLVDHRREPELELLEGQIPLAVPMRMGHDEEAVRAHRGDCHASDVAYSRASA